MGVEKKHPLGGLEDGCFGGWTVLGLQAKESVMRIRHPAVNVLELNFLK